VVLWAIVPLVGHEVKYLLSFLWVVILDSYHEMVVEIDLSVVLWVGLEGTYL